VRAVAVCALFGWGCASKQPAPPPPFELVSASPSTVPLHGGVTVTVTYAGELGDSVVVYPDYDGQGPPTPVDTVAHTFAFVARPGLAGPAAIDVYDPRSKTTVDDDTILTYVPTAAVPALAVGVSTLDFPLHPELTRPCARVATVTLVNSGETPLDAISASCDDAAFTATIDAMCGPIADNASCPIQICFDSSVPGAHSSTLTVHTSGGDATTALTATVLAATTDLAGAQIVDPNDNAIPSTIATPAGDRLIGWARTNLFALDLAGNEIDQSVAPTVSGFPAWMYNVRTSSGVHVLVGDTSGGHYGALVHYDAQLAADTAFGQVDLPTDSGIGYWRGLEVTASGRIVAIAMEPPTVVAVANGAVDTTYGTSGRTVLSGTFGGVSAIDSQGRLYVGLGDHAVRLTSTGALDGTFTFSSPVHALAVDASDRLYIASDGYAARVDTTGTPVVSIDTASQPVSDIAVDATGRIYLTVNGQIDRYTATGTLDRTLGFDSTLGVRCGSAHPCWISGTNVDRDPNVPLQYNYESYVLRLAD